MGYRISVDSGGTFTDGVLTDEHGTALMRKAHTTPHDPTLGTLDCIGKLAEARGVSLGELLAQTQSVVLGTTMATNVVATLSGPRMGTIATRGYRLRMAFPQVSKVEWREGPQDMYDFRTEPPQPLTPYHLMTEVDERVDFRGEVLTPVDEADVRRAARELAAQDVSTVAVMLLHSHVNPAHERRVAEILAEEAPQMQVTLSSSVLPVAGETERWGTAMFCAYIAPVVRAFVARIGGLLEKNGFKGQLLFIQSNGGIATPEIVAENPAVLLLSGPAAGPSLGRALGAEHGYSNVLSVDMGGTSFDIGVVHDGTVDTVKQKIIDGKKFALPCVDVTAIGAGGGSIAYVDQAGRLQVGPKSAGANPGPACYGKGGEQPTVTDANVVLGYIDPGFFLGGTTKLRKDLSEKVIRERIAEPLGLSVPEAAAAIYEVINANMASGTDVAFAKRGYDPRDFALVAAGGAAAVHAVRIMQELRIRKLIVPKVAPTYCAYGMQFCDVRHDFQRSYHAETDKADCERIDALLAGMEREARDTLRREGVAEAAMVIRRSIEMRYYGQFRERAAPLADGPVTAASLQGALQAFHRVHEQTVGYSDAAYPTEIVRLHVSGGTATQAPSLQPVPPATGLDAARKGRRPAWFSGQGFVDTPVYDGDRLGAGAVVEGPAIVEETFTTFVLPPGARTQVDRHGHFVTTAQEA
ncbi:MAG: hydantoinase/oxoprolinase family protein [Burkholderiaceae bacterium]|nr:hydantoinase/oxoprolinase family protein [Burkholderiaceae bacterium]